MFASGSRLGVAVSGGADSVFLLHALRELGNAELSIIHIEHGIRGEASRQDAAFVQALAEKCGLPFHIHHSDVPAIPDNQEQAARDVRRKFFAELIAKGAVERIATGHTRSDQAETVLFRILRGAGLAGIAGILPVTKEGIVRPLLEIDRSEIEAWLRGRNISWREDASNQNRAYARNRLRHEILPLLRETFNPNLDEALANMATLAHDEECYWESILPIPEPQAPSPQTLTRSELTTNPPALARRLTRAAISRAKGDLRQIDFAHIERILEMAQSPDGHNRVQIPGLDVVRSLEWIRLVPANFLKPVVDFSVPLEAPGSVELPGSGTRITLQVLEKSASPNAYATVGDELDWQRLSAIRGALPNIELRNWRPGDQYQPQGHSKEQKIKNLFQDARIPLWERGYWPIITYNGIIVWTQKFGAAAEFAAGPSTRVVLRVEVSSEISNRASSV